MIGFCCEELNEFGPIHEYVPPPLELRLSVVPLQTGLLLEAVAVGSGFTVTGVVALAEHPFGFVTVTVYVPLAAVVTLGMLGFCADEVNEFGPDHVYDVMLLGPEDRFSVLPAQTGLLLDAVAVGKVFTTRVTLPDVTLPQVPVTTTL